MGEEGKDSVDTSNMMFIVVRNLKSQSGATNAKDFEIHKGDTIKVGRLKFCVKDFRTKSTQANEDLKRSETEKNPSPIKRKFRYGLQDEDSENDFHEEEAVEIDCGVVDASSVAEGEEAI